MDAWTTDSPELTDPLIAPAAVAHARGVARLEQLGDAETARAGRLRPGDVELASARLAEIRAPQERA